MSAKALSIESDNVARVMRLAKSLTMKEIINGAGEGAFTRMQQRKRVDLLHAIESSPALQTAVEEAYAHKQEAHEGSRHDQIKHVRFCDDDSSPDPAYDSFLRDVDETVKQNCLSNFIDCTGNDQTHKVVCVICAGEFFTSETSLVNITDLPSQQLLVPIEQCRHSAQKTVSSMLLYTPSITNHDRLCKGYVCSSCMHNLRSNRIPSHALANGLWVGEIPAELSILSLPERILIGLYYPAAFVIKLYPQKKGAKNWDTSALNSGIRGNVSTYQLNTKDICSMIEGNLLPHHPEILAATIGVSIIGPNNLPA
ncbi:hypothetical protein DFJ58DRAFT_737628 [Suillus subalutaceus]|uniref:uncharacterized protein n=1 Tax=Suillus subalutaceus TaxID=48586 RepID=UPI001B873996|nr:uncharacterized protein DFJ58DRAFT_737628 [Suillus subalutaceus]KAG1828765.1 hypothetical protein DFJ58DRAFT_737628 [Suillus subalutaceus]